MENSRAEKFVERAVRSLSVEARVSYQVALQEVLEMACYISHTRGELNLLDLARVLQDAPQPGPDWAAKKLAASRASFLFRPKKARKLGRNQRVVLDKLVKFGRWDYPGLWNYGAVSGTKAVLEALTERGFAVKVQTKSPAPSFEPAEHLKACGVCQRRFRELPHPAVQVDVYGRFATCSSECRRCLSGLE